MSDFPEMKYKSDPEGMEVAADATPLDFFFAVFRNPRQPMNRRMKAASEAAQYVHPKLAAVANMSGDDFAAQLERAINRSAKVINAAPVPQLVEGPPSALEHRPAPPDRRFRRD